MLPQEEEEEKKEEREHKETFGGNAYVYYVDGGNDNTSVYICPDSPLNYIHVLCAGFLYANYTSIKLGVGK